VNILSKIYKLNRMKQRRKGGGPLPYSYFNPSASNPSANGGRDIMSVHGPIIRPIIGGTKRMKRMKRMKRTKRTTRIKRKSGGFVPTVMEGFVTATSKYIAPLALLSGYRLMTGKKLFTTSTTRPKKYRGRTVKRRVRFSKRNNTKYI
jgi:hypothetical protein